MKIWKNMVLFYLGGMGYQVLELCWRGYTHGSMFVAGGLCFLLIGHLNRVTPRLPLPLRAVCGGLIVTMVELAAGMLVNRQYTVWDYRGLPGNFMGQICPAFTALWIPVALGALLIFSPLERTLFPGK